MRNLIYIGEELPAEGHGFIKPFQERETELQFDWDQVMQMICARTATIRQATDEEMGSARLNADLIRACVVYLGQFMQTEEV